MGATNSISFYKNIYQNSSTETLPIDIFLSKIQDGEWQDKVLNIRLIKDYENRKKAKEKLPYVTISGIFNGTRKANELSLHSGFISMDIDNIANELEGIRTLLNSDPYVFAAFTSVSGTGLCVLFKIDTDRHLDAFNGIADYLIKKYQIIIDPSGKDVSRPRYVSFDPQLLINEHSLVFKKYLQKEKKRKVTSTIFVKTEFDQVISEMVKNNVSCVEDYRDWLNIGFGLADQFGEAGRAYFHSLSSCSQKYETSMCDRQYTHCLRQPSSTGKVTIATIYFFAKQAGINIHGEKTKRIAAATSTGKAAGLSAKQIADNLQKFEGIEAAEEVINQAFVSNASFSQGESIVENIRMWLRHNYELKRNVITRKVEINGSDLEEVDINTMFLDAKILFDELDKSLFTTIIFSRNTPDYNPVKELIESIEWDGEKRLMQLGACITSDTGTLDWRCRMAKTWYIGIISSVYGEVSELNFILVGDKNTGKTQFFKKLLPPELDNYFAGSQLNRGKDDEILMCEKIIILNDEYGGKNKMDERNEKRLMASPNFSLRVPYGKGNETIKRIANLCGTCNERDPLDDATGNRRIIVMEANGKFNFSLYNSLDKYQMLAEALVCFNNGDRPVLSDEDIIQLEEVTDGAYSKVSIEGELIQQWFNGPEKCNPWDFMTTTQIKVKLEAHTRANLNINKIGSQLRKLGYERVREKTIWGYNISAIPVILQGV
jgi:predicted P-loop ATPase